MRYSKNKRGFSPWLLGFSGQSTCIDIKNGLGFKEWDRFFLQRLYHPIFRNKKDFWGVEKKSRTFARVQILNDEIAPLTRAFLSLSCPILFLNVCSLAVCTHLLRWVLWRASWHCSPLPSIGGKKWHCGLWWHKSLTASMAHLPVCCAYTKFCPIGTEK